MVRPDPPVTANDLNAIFAGTSTDAAQGDVINPIRTRDRDGMLGEQRLFRFDNGYGASVIKGPHTHGGPAGLWELGVIVWTGETFGLTYDTPITNDVIGYLTEDDVQSLLVQIRALPATGGAE